MGFLRFAGPFAFLAAVPILYGLSDVAPLLVSPGLLLTLLAASYIPEKKQREAHWSDRHRLLPVLYIVFQLGVTAWAAFEITRGGESANGFLSLTISVGVCSGVFGTLAAHELIHSRRGWHSLLGILMLTCIGYRHFRIAHLFGHHRFAATGKDPSTARLGENFYGFFLRTLIFQARFAWQFEQWRLRGRPLSMLRNRIGLDMTIMAALYAALLFLAGWRAAAFLSVQSFVAIIVLELFNYVAHYGLLRRPGERMRDHHSWDSSGAANLLLFNMGRHSRHHRAPSAEYGTLVTAPCALKLPGGYAGAILLALVPPLWRKATHRRLRAHGAPPCESRYAAAADPAAAAP